MKRLLRTVLFIIAFLHLANVNCRGEEDHHELFYDNVKFIGVYKSDGSRECIMAIGNEAEINKCKFYAEKRKDRTFLFVLLTKGGGSSIINIHNLTDKLEMRSKGQFAPLNGATVIDVFANAAKAYARSVTHIPPQDNPLESSK